MKLHATERRLVHDKGTFLPKHYVGMGDSGSSVTCVRKATCANGRQHYYCDTYYNQYSKLLLHESVCEVLLIGCRCSVVCGPCQGF